MPDRSVECDWGGGAVMEGVNHGAQNAAGRVCCLGLHRGCG